MTRKRFYIPIALSLMMFIVRCVQERNLKDNIWLQVACDSSKNSSYPTRAAPNVKGAERAKLIRISRVVVSGIGAVVDFGKSGYMEITP